MKRRALIIMVMSMLLLAITVPASAATIADGLYLFADDNKYTYLGKLTSNTYDADSIYNPYGLHGSKYAAESIFNQYSIYGSSYSVYSPFNRYTVTPPIIAHFSNGSIVSTYRLTINPNVPGAISPVYLFEVLKANGI